MSNNIIEGIHNFGYNSTLNLDMIDAVIATELQTSVLPTLQSAGISAKISEQARLKRNYSDETTKQPRRYLAKAEIPITTHDRPLGTGTMYVCVFRPGEGTGDTKENSSFPGLHLPDYWHPRKKSGVGEFVFPIGTGVNNIWYTGITSLIESALHPQDNLPFDYKIISLPKTTFAHLIIPSSGLEERLAHPKKIDTTFLNHEGRHEGEPHMIGFDASALPNNERYNNCFQIAAFLAFPEATDAFKRLLAVVDAHK